MPVADVDDGDFTEGVAALDDLVDDGPSGILGPGMPISADSVGAMSTARRSATASWCLIPGPLMTNVACMLMLFARSIVFGR